MRATRRAFLGSLPGLAGAAVFAAQQRASASLPQNRPSPLDGIAREKIRITDIKVTNLAYRLAPEEQRQDGLVTIANANVMAAVPNRFLLESNITPNPLKEGLFKEKLAVKGGYLDIPDKPGLGVELREGLAEEYPPLPGPWYVPDPETD